MQLPNLKWNGNTDENGMLIRNYGPVADDWFMPEELFYNTYIKQLEGIYKDKKTVKVEHPEEELKDGRRQLYKDDMKYVRDIVMIDISDHTILRMYFFLFIYKVIRSAFIYTHFLYH